MNEHSEREFKKWLKEEFGNILPGYTERHLPEVKKAFHAGFQACVDIIAEAVGLPKEGGEDVE